METFSSDQRTEIQTYFQENGYVVIRNVISEEQIGFFMENYERFKSAKSYFYRSQDTNRGEQVAINEQGFIEHSILNPTDLVFQKRLRTSVANIIYSSAISQLLTTITERQQHTVWQTMFFDKSTGTVAHQDHYYLDTEPAGNLIACWFALETIEIDAGPFFVIPKSHKGPVISSQLGSKFADHKEYVAKMQQLIDENNYRPQPMPLEKGSILLWHPYLVHGAFQNLNPLHSRKSFTAHYIPEGYTKLGRQTLDARKASFNPNILVWKKSMLEQAKEHLRYFRNWREVKFRNDDDQSHMEMRGTKY